MFFEINGLTGFLFLDMIIIWFLINAVILVLFMIFGTLFIDNGILTINNNNIIDKIIKLKNDDKQLYKFTKKLSKDNISFLIKYKLIKLDRLVLTPNFNQEVKETFINDNEKRLYNKIESIIYYYDLLNK